MRNRSVLASYLLVDGSLDMSLLVSCCTGYPLSEKLFLSQSLSSSSLSRFLASFSAGPRGSKRQKTFKIKPTIEKI